MFSPSTDGHRLSHLLHWPSSTSTTSHSSSSSLSSRSQLSSLSTTSSLSSTFSDVSISSIPPPSPSPQPASKTNAFFASPFSPTPSPPPSPPRKSDVKPSRNLTADFFSKSYTDPVSPSSPSSPLPPMSRIFPSRYTTMARRSSPPPSAGFVTLDESTLAPEQDLAGESRRPALPTLNLTTPGSNTKLLQDLVSASDNEPTPRPPAKVPSTLKVIIPNNTPNASFEGDGALQELEPGMIITSPGYTHDHLSPAPSSSHLRFPHSDASASTLRLRLVKLLGHGAFSSVWLADDLSTTALSLISKRSLRELKRKASALSRTSSLGKRSTEATKSYHPDVLSASPVDMEHGEGIKPSESLPIVIPPTPPCEPSICGSYTESAFPSRASSLKSSISRAGSMKSVRRPRAGEDGASKIVAVKMTLRDGGFGPGMEGDKERERTQAAFIREVEVLRHISHPNITTLLASLTTTTHHMLVLPYLPGGDLLALVNSDIAWSHLGEDVLRRLWCELCKAVGWMHSVGIVHRDIKLENVLLTTTAFMDLEKQDESSWRRPTLDSLPAPPLPLIKLTDFGLSRFIDVPSPASASSASDEGSHEGFKEQRDSGRLSPYDAPGASGLKRRPAKKDRPHRTRTLLSTRCGSEAYAAPELVMGGGGDGHPGIYDARETDAWACGVVLYALVARKLPFGEGVSIDAGKINGENGRRGGVAERRAWLMRIARGEWIWPTSSGSAEESMDCEDGVLVGKRLVESAGAKRMVERLLIRDPTKRANMEELWDDEWMQGVGVVPSFASNPYVFSPSSRATTLADEDDLFEYKVAAEEGQDQDGEGEEDEEVEDDHGWLLDEEGIQSIARQEVV
ncbi:hypothetical protein AX16_002898 [Volvariella volvacea WC 439]|nr:hypothetical protein AX16_002898 [Volvariella volvacea WC 439]